MKAFQIRFASLLIVLGLVYACEKDRKTRECTVEASRPCAIDSNEVNIRVANQTGFPVCDFKLDFNLDTSMVIGGILAGDTTCYFTVDKALLSPGLDFRIGAGLFSLTKGTNGATMENDSAFITYDLFITQRLDTVKNELIYETFSVPTVIKF